MSRHLTNTAKKKKDRALSLFIQDTGKAICKKLFIINTVNCIFMSPIFSSEDNIITYTAN